VGVDTAYSAKKGAAYNSIEIFSFAKFRQIAEFNYRLDSYTKYGQIIDFIFRWLQKQVGNNIILAMENNTIGRAPIEHLLNHVTDINYRDFIYREPNAKDFGITTTGISKDLMIGCLTEVLKEDPTVIKSQILINQMSAIERNRGGSVSSDTFSDLFMSASFCAYVRRTKAIEIMPLITLGVNVVDAARIDTFKAFINTNTNLLSTQEQHNKDYNIFNEDEINQLMLVDLERRNQSKEEKFEDYFSPFL